MACEAPWDFGCVTAADVLLSPSLFARRDAVEAIDRLEESARQCSATYLQLTREGTYSGSLTVLK